jgi:hypothetical protein
MRALLTAAILVALFATPATASIELEAGATFYDNGTCVEQNGAPGFGMPDGECITVADYDEMFSYENLSSIPSLTNPSLSIAEEAELEPDVSASERLLGIGLVDEPFTFFVTVDGQVMM